MFSIISAELDTEAPMHAASPATWTADGDTWTRGVGGGGVDLAVGALQRRVWKEGGA